MSTKASREVKKAMAYDLIQIIEKNTEKDSYTAQEVIGLIKTYITATTAK